MTATPELSPKVKKLADVAIARLPFGITHIKLKKADLEERLDDLGYYKMFGRICLTGARFNLITRGHDYLRVLIPDEDQDVLNGSEIYTPRLKVRFPIVMHLAPDLDTFNTDSSTFLPNGS